MRWTGICRGERARAVTLVEVVAALALLAGTVTALLLAHARAVHQLAFADERAQVALAVEELVTGWALDKEDLRVPVEGGLVTPRNWTWRREAVAFDAEDGSKLFRVRLAAVRIAEDGAPAATYAIEWLFDANER